VIPIGTSIEVREFPAAVTGIIVANVGMFVLMSGLSAAELDVFVRHYALIPARYAAPDIVRLDPFDPLPLLVNVFLHGSLVHLLVNMWTLWLFGRVLEDHVGTWRFLALYIAGGLAADAAHILTNLSSTVPALGASGAVAAVMAAVIAQHPRSRITLLVPIGFFPLLIPLPVLIYGGIWFGLQVLQGLWQFAEPQGAGGIAWWAHVGGFVAGPLIASILGGRGHQPRIVGADRPRLQLIGFQRIRPVKQSTPTRDRQSVISRNNRRQSSAEKRQKMARPMKPGRPKRRTAVPVTEPRSSPAKARGGRGSIPTTVQINHLSDRADTLQRPLPSAGRIALHIPQFILRAVLNRSNR
jgi:membrane associated rhomboid family serine protease